MDNGQWRADKRFFVSGWKRAQLEAM